ncbi:MAG: hypothetical protein J7J07_02925 [Syntrophobacterales bacterium]|nr:hypothetical protein [Syntrophobacterales bacterium]
MGTNKFPVQKWAIFRKVKEIKGLCGGVIMHAAQTIPQIDLSAPACAVCTADRCGYAQADAGVAEKGPFWMETNEIRRRVNGRENQSENTCRGNGRR